MWMVGKLCSSCFLLQIFLGERTYQPKELRPGQVGSDMAISISFIWNWAGQFHSLPQRHSASSISFTPVKPYISTWSMDQKQGNSCGHHPPDRESTTQSLSFAYSRVTNVLVVVSTGTGDSMERAACWPAWEPSTRGRGGSRGRKWCPGLVPWPRVFICSGSAPEAYRHKFGLGAIIGQCLASSSLGGLKMLGLTSWFSLSFPHGLKRRLQP